MFVDEIEIKVRGGDGGPGCLSFRREKYVPRGGPDGGDGGDGGSVSLVATSSQSTLAALQGVAEFAAEQGGAGSAANCTGREGGDKRLEVPVGTMVFDAERGNLLADLAVVGDSVVVARGGRRGRGNKSFATATNRTPRQVEPGIQGERRTLRLVLKLIADAGLCGLPNAGKSTLLSVVSRARPRIANYPFTTLSPCLGIVAWGERPSFVMADIPGLIEGASAGKGLGHQFLRHVERTRLLVHLVDCSEAAAMAPAPAYHTVRAELVAYSPELAGRLELVVATKVESAAARELAAELEAAVGRPVIAISAATHEGLDRLIDAILAELAQAQPEIGR
jgi:GTP-binding protein